MCKFIDRLPPHITIVHLDAPRTHAPEDLHGLPFKVTWRDRLDYWWFVWGNEVCKAAFAFISIAWMFYALYLWGPLIKAGLGSYLNG